MGSLLRRNVPARFFRYLAVAVFLAIAAGIVAHWMNRETLADFADEPDLRHFEKKHRQLSPLEKTLSYFFPSQYLSRRERLVALLQQTVPSEFWGPGSGAGYLWRQETNAGSRFVLLMAKRTKVLNADPPEDDLTVSIHFLDSNAKYQGNSQFSLCAHEILSEATLVDHPIVGAPVIRIRTFINGIGRESGPRFYGVFRDRVALLRIESLNGRLDSYDYRDSKHSVGPAPPTRTEMEWEALLNSVDLREVLEGLTWIGAMHDLRADLDGIDPGELPADMRLIAAVRRRPGVQRKIAELTESNNQWIREAALLAQFWIPKKST
ncbi:MAG: hypothetical protein HY040_21695 [Planctomycetes bacterium]|nr:hypothetical protein [Planctomycetota bacterium]